MANRAFIRFRNITIPNYSEVSNVFARFTAYSDRSDTPVNLRCAFVNEDNPAAPTSYAELQAVNLTDWVSWSTLNSWTNGQVYDTPDLTEILQSIIEREGWSYDNSVILIIEDVSSSGQRGFSSIQFDSGNEKTVLFVTYIAREYTLAVDDEFAGDDGSIPNTNLWFLPDQGYYTKPIIQDGMLYSSLSGFPYARLYSTWYSFAPLDVQVDWDGRGLSPTGSLSYMYFGVTYKNAPTRETSVHSTLCKWEYNGLTGQMHGFLENNRYSPYQESDNGTWRLSVNVSGSNYRVRFYFDGVLYHQETSDAVIGYPYLGVVYQVLYNPGVSPVESCIGTFDNFVINTGQPVSKT